MRMSIVLAVSLALLGVYCGYRIAALEGRVDALTKRLGAPSPSREPATQGASPAEGYEQRIRALEKDARSLRADLHTLEEATGERPTAAELERPASPEQILSVVTREQNRIRDRQLEFHRARWVEWRDAALSAFANDQHLTEVQSEDVRQLLVKETDRLIEILRRPDVLENPAQAATDWAAVLDDTDAIVLRVLDPGQRTAWRQGRALERRTFWPWLPKSENE